MSSVYRKPYADMETSAKKVSPTDDQKRAVESIFSTDKTVSLLFGVTGSGKTEVYMEAIERTLAEGKKAIMLVPEISLTPQTLRNFRARFSGRVALMHSGRRGGHSRRREERGIRASRQRGTDYP